jgi:hypothetical protein
LQISVFLWNRTYFYVIIQKLTMYLRIENPCHENWSQMTPLEKGRFCDACQKKVHDFTSSSKQELIDLYQLNEGHLCGRVKTAFLTEQFVTYQQNKNYLHYLKTFCLAAIIGFGASLFTVKSALASNLNKLKNEYLTIQDSINLVEIKGVVRDKENKELLPFCSVVIMKGDSVIANAFTDMDGKFSLKIDSKKFPEFDLKVQYVGYHNLLLKNIKADQKELVFELEAQPAEILGLIIYEERPTPIIDPFFRGTKIGGDQYRRMPK